MASILKRQNSDGTYVYRVMIRKKNVDIYKTFRDEDDAKLFCRWKEKLINNMENFDVPITDQIYLSYIFELKINSIKNEKPRAVEEFNNSCDRISSHMKEHKFVCQYTYDDWLECAKSMSKMIIHRGSKNNKIVMSINTLRRMFANASSAFSYCQGLGLNLENMPLKIIQTFITPNLGQPS